MNNDAIILAKIMSYVSKSDITVKEKIVDYLANTHNWNRRDAIRVVLKQIPLYYLTYAEFVVFVDSISRTTEFRIDEFPDRFVFANRSIMSQPNKVIQTIDGVERLSAGQYGTIISAHHIAQLNNEGFVYNNIDPNRMDIPSEYLDYLKTKRCDVADVKRVVSEVLKSKFEINQIVWNAVSGVSYNHETKQIRFADNCVVISETPMYDIAICSMFSNAEYRKKTIDCRFPVTLRGVE